MIRLVNLLLAEVAAYLTYLECVSSPLRYFIPPSMALLLFIPPLVGAFFKKPFSYHYYLLLFAFNLPGFFHTEFFKGLFDVVYALGFREITEVYNIFSGYGGNFQTLLAITWLFITAEVLQGNWESINAAKENGVECEGCYLAPLPALAILAALFFVFQYLSAIKIPHNLDMLLAALLGVFTFIAGSYLLMKSVEER